MLVVVSHPSHTWDLLQLQLSGIKRNTEIIVANTSTWPYITLYLSLRSAHELVLPQSFFTSLALPSRVLSDNSMLLGISILSLVGLFVTKATKVDDSCKAQNPMYTCGSTTTVLVCTINAELNLVWKTMKQCTSGTHCAYNEGEDWYDCYPNWSRNL